MSATDTQRWFVRIRGKVIGPFGLDQLQSLRDRGRIQPEHEVSRDRRVWEPAGNLAGLFAPAAAEPDVGFSLSPTFDVPGSPTDGEAAWYYARDNVERGPVSWKALKRMALSGELAADDRVWKGGMPEWEVASEIPDLFVSGRPAPSGRRSANGQTRRSENVSRMLCDDLLNQIRRQITAADLESACRTLILMGGYALLMAMVAGPGLLIVRAIKADSISVGFMAVGALFGLVVLRYVAIRLSGACHALVQSSPHRLSSSAFPDAVALCLLFAGIAAICYAVFEGIRMESRVVGVIGFAFGMQSLAICTFAACAALHPTWLNVDCSAPVRAGEEGIGILAFLLKLCLRFAPINFGVNASLGALGLTAALIMLLAGEKWKLESFEAASASALFVLASAAIPLVSYLLMALLSISLDCCQSLLVLPDQMRGSSSAAESPDPN